MTGIRDEDDGDTGRRRRGYRTEKRRKRRRRGQRKGLGQLGSGSLLFSYISSSFYILCSDYTSLYIHISGRVFLPLSLGLCPVIRTRNDHLTIGLPVVIESKSKKTCIYDVTGQCVI